MWEQPGILTGDWKSWWACSLWSPPSLSSSKTKSPASPWKKHVYTSRTQMLQLPQREMDPKSSSSWCWQSSAFTSPPGQYDTKKWCYMDVQTPLATILPGSEQSKLNHPAPEWFWWRLDCTSNILTFPDTAWRLGFQLSCTGETMEQIIRIHETEQACAHFPHLWDNPLLGPIKIKTAEWIITKIWEATRTSG